MKNYMILAKLFLFLLVFLTHEKVLSNNIQVSTPSFTGYNSASQTVRIKCNVSWENSWRNATNYDAAWIFVKYRIDKGEWKHAQLSTNVGSYTVPTGASLETVPDGGGVFVYRSSNSSNATFNVNNLQLNWPYSNNNVPNNANLEVKVFAIEMVYVPQGAFWVGNGNGQVGYSFYNAGSPSTSYQISSEGIIVIDDTPPSSLVQTTFGVTNALWASGFIGNGPTDPYDTLSSAFPKGFKAFYCMKHEINQLAYVDFLNTLSYTQQANHTIAAPNSVAGTAALIASNANRNGIDIMTPGVSSGIPAVYACNLDGDNIYNENNDGAHIACSGLSWADLGAYLDWAALRPMTEFEFEKACRGTSTPTFGEFAWGDSSVSSVNYGNNGGLDSSGTPVEGIKSINFGNGGNAAVITTMQGFASPLRGGIFAANAANNNNRIRSGASVYGIMELSGNVQERCVTIFNKAIGRSFTGTHGDGLLTSDGYSNAASWPGIDAAGVGFRGGAFNYSSSVARVSNRNFISPIAPLRYNYAGGRGVRTAP